MSNKTSLSEITAYKSNSEFLKELDQVLQADYGATLNKTELEDSGESFSIMMKKLI